MFMMHSLDNDNSYQ